MNFEVRFAKFKQYVFPYNVQIYDYSKKNSFKSSQTILRNKKNIYLKRLRSIQALSHYNTF